MELKQLKYFVTVVQEGNISKAAEKLSISQPPFSTKLKELEIELGVVLFERGVRKIEMTEAGTMFYQRALSILELTELAQQELADYKEGKLGTLRIGMISSVSTSLANEWIPEFHKTYPDIHLDLFEGNTYEQIEKLKNNLIELAVVRTPFNAESLECTTLRKENMVALGDSSFFSGITSDTITLNDIQKQPLIIYRRWEKILSDAFYQYGCEPNIFCRSDDARTTISMADACLGISIVPESALALSRNQRLMKKVISQNNLQSSICVLRNPNSYLSTLAELFYQFLVNY
ncbi:MAG: LysR family transcriptional regulator [Clostridiales bacterium]|nr:LysR family transcriptional regulator [Clostridiales bacterium]